MRVLDWVEQLIQERAKRVFEGRKVPPMRDEFEVELDRQFKLLHKALDRLMTEEEKRADQTSAVPK